MPEDNTVANSFLGLLININALSRVGKLRQPKQLMRTAHRHLQEHPQIDGAAGARQARMVIQCASQQTTSKAPA